MRTRNDISAEADGQIAETEFLGFVSSLEDICHAETTNAFRSRKMGEKAPRCLSGLSTVLSILDRLATCWWGCDGGDHVGQYLTGRVVSSSTAAIRLAFSGYYDECLALTRNVGEVANLYWLFYHDRQTLELWKQADDGTRRKDYCPVQVRLKLERLGQHVPISEDRYRALCEGGTHVTPSTQPEHHSIGHRGTGWMFQGPGLALSLNELALPLTHIVSVAPTLLCVNVAVLEKSRQAAIALAESLGGITIDVTERPWVTGGKLTSAAPDAAPRRQVQRPG